MNSDYVREKTSQLAGFKPAEQAPYHHPLLKLGGTLVRGDEGLIGRLILLLSVVVEVAAYSVNVMILCCDILCGKGQVNQHVMVVCVVKYVVVKFVVWGILSE